jgi:hypothetical protein
VSRTRVALLLAIAAAAATARVAAQITPASRDGFVMRVVTTGLAGSRLCGAGRLFVGDRAHRTGRANQPRGCTTTTILTVGDVLADGLGGLLGLAQFVVALIQGAPTRVHGPAKAGHYRKLHRGHARFR